MADEKLHSLSVAIEANTKGIEKALKRVEKQLSGGLGTVKAKKDVASLETALAKADRRLAGFGAGLGRQLVPSLGAIGAALGTGAVIKYAEAWTGAKNSLAVAGVTGAKQAEVLERLYDAAQANAAPITALADLYGKAAQASDNLGASQEELLRFSGGVATALRVAGTSAGAASGALTQLGQLLGSAKVQAEEFNSLNDSARPILIAVAHGLDAAGGSVSKLKALVNEGKVSGQQFFQAFLKGLPEVEKMAANATQTIEQGMIKVGNALTKFIGSSDESLGASQRLVSGLNALADNFDAVADVTLKVASIIAGALVGRAIVGMIAKLGLGAAALIRFATALRTAATVGSLSTALASVSAAAGPLGWLIGGTVVGALALFGTQSAEASAGARTYAEALKEIEEAAPKAADAVENAGQRFTEQARNSITAGISEGKAEIEEARTAVVNLFDEIIANAPRRLITEEQLGQLGDLRDVLKDGTTEANTAKDALYSLANANPAFQRLADQFAPLLDTLAKAIGATGILQNRLANLGGGGSSFREAEDASMAAYGKMVETGQSYATEARRRASLTADQRAKEDEIARIKKEIDAAGGYLRDSEISALAVSNISSRSSKRGGGSKREKADEYDRATKSVIDYTAALVAETEAQRQINPLVDDYGYAAEKARIERELLTAAEEAGKSITPQLREEIAALADQYATAGAEAAKLAEQQRLTVENAEFAKDILRDSLSGLVDALKDGKLEWKELGEIAVNALDRIADRRRDESLIFIIGG